MSRYKHLILLTPLALATGAVASEGPNRGGASAAGTTGLEPSTVSEVVNAAGPAYQACYGKGAGKGKHLPSGKLEVKFTVGVDGKVQAASIASSALENPSIEECLLGEIKGLSFPAPRGGGSVDVTYPFHFTQKPTKPTGKKK